MTDPIADADQQTAADRLNRRVDKRLAASVLAESCRVFYDELVATGFTDEEATHLAAAWLKAVVSS